MVDPETGAVLNAEHGMNGGDEVNLIRPGANYGWPTYTFSRQYDGAQGSALPTADGHRAAADPVEPVDRASGLMIYRGDRFPAWKGNLFVGSARRGEITFTGGLERVVLGADMGDVRRETLLTELHQRVRDFAEGPDGLIYVLTDGNENAVLRIEPSRCRPNKSRLSRRARAIACRRSATSRSRSHASACPSAPCCSALLLALVRARRWHAPGAGRGRRSQFHSFSGSCSRAAIRTPSWRSTARSTTPASGSTRTTASRRAARRPTCCSARSRTGCTPRRRRYIRTTNRHFTITVSDATYRRMKQEVVAWRDAPGKYYDLDTRNCIHFVGRIAELGGLRVDYPPAMLRKPKAWLNHITTLNPQLGRAADPLSARAAPLAERGSRP